MDRLTMTSDKGGLAFTFDLDVTCKRREMDKIVALGERLKAYEDAEEQGLLVRLPCKVGDTVYRVLRHCTESEFGDCIGCQRNINGICQPAFFEQEFSVALYDGLGKTVFLTREEAERKLKENT